MQLAQLRDTRCTCAGSRTKNPWGKSGKLSRPCACLLAESRKSEFFRWYVTACVFPRFPHDLIDVDVDLDLELALSLAAVSPIVFVLASVCQKKSWVLRTGNTPAQRSSIFARGCTCNLPKARRSYKSHPDTSRCARGHRGAAWGRTGSHSRN